MKKYLWLVVLTFGLAAPQAARAQGAIVAKVIEFLWDVAAGYTDRLPDAKCDDFYLFSPEWRDEGNQIDRDRQAEAVDRQRACDEADSYSDEDEGDGWSTT